MSKAEVGTCCRQLPPQSGRATLICAFSFSASAQTISSWEAQGTADVVELQN